MVWHKEIWTYLIVTLVAVLIWAWAASETREQRTISSAKVQFEVRADPGNWLIEPASVAPSVVVEGTKLSVQALANLLRKPINIAVPVNVSRYSRDLAELLREQESIIATGAAIVSTEPASIDLALDQIDREPILVKPILPGVTAEGEIVAQPNVVTVSMPHSLKQRLPQDFQVEAFMPASQLEQLERGEPQSLEVRLRMPEAFAAEPNVRISPASVRLNFTIRSRIRETKVESARVLIDSAAENLDAYTIEVEPKLLRGLTVEADADLSRRIEAGEVPVVAIVHLRSSEVEAQIDHKSVSYFMAHVPNGDGVTYEKLGVKPGTSLPVINLKITRRTPAQ